MTIVNVTPVTYVTITALFGNRTLMNHLSIAGVVEWATFNNLQFTEHEADVKPGFQTFTVERMDKAPLNEEALSALRQVRWRHTTIHGFTNTHEGVGCGEAHSAIARMRRNNGTE